MSGQLGRGSSSGGLVGTRSAYMDDRCYMQHPIKPRAVCSPCHLVYPLVRSVDTHRARMLGCSASSVAISVASPSRSRGAHSAPSRSRVGPINSVETVSSVSIATGSLGSRSGAVSGVARSTPGTTLFYELLLAGGLVT